MQRLDLALTFAPGCAVTDAVADFAAFDPIERRGQYPTDLGRNGLQVAHSDGCSPRCSGTRRTARSHISGEFVLIAYSRSILSKIGAPAKSEAIHLLG